VMKVRYGRFSGGFRCFHLRNRRLTAAPGISHTPRKPIGFPILILVASDYKTTIINAGQIDGSSSGKAIQLGSGDNTVRIQGGQASVQGNIDGGVGGNNTLQFAPGAGATFGYDGAISNFQNVIVESGITRLSGINSYTGLTSVQKDATLVLDGVGRLASAGSLALAGGTLVLENADGVIGQSFAGLTLSGHSQILLNGSALSFSTLDGIANGSLLSISGVGGLGYALRFAGNYTGQTDFLSLIAGTTIDGHAATFRFDGGYTNIAAVPEPESYALFLAGLGLLGTIARRRKIA
jgi:hypothetical protein